MGHGRILKPRYFIEFCGSAVLITMGLGSAVIAGDTIGALGIGLAFGLTVMFLIYTIGSQSECHINPGVTLVMFLSGKVSFADALFYIIMQLLGGMVGGYIVYLVAVGKAGFDLSLGFEANGFGVHSPDGYSMYSVMLAEFLMTSVLLMAVFSTLQPGFPAGFSGLFIGLVLMTVHLVSLPISNTSVNFARSVGAAFVERGWALEQLWLFAVTQVGAAVFVSIVQRCFFKNRPN